MTEVLRSSAELSGNDSLVTVSKNGEWLAETGFIPPELIPEVQLPMHVAQRLQAADERMRKITQGMMETIGSFPEPLRIEAFAGHRSRLAQEAIVDYMKSHVSQNRAHRSGWCLTDPNAHAKGNEVDVAVIQAESNVPLWNGYYYAGVLSLSGELNLRQRSADDLLLLVMQEQGFVADKREQWSLDDRNRRHRNWHFTYMDEA